MRLRHFVTLTTLFMLALACQPDRASQKVKQKTPPSYRIVVENLSRSGNYYQIGDTLSLSVEWLREGPMTGELIFMYEGDPIGSLSEVTEKIEWVIPAKTGQRQLRAEHEVGNKYIGLSILSDITPVKWDWELIRTYPHDPEAYTQGLYYRDGILYEGTGLKKRSSLRKVDMESGKLIQSTNLPAEIFGEGITLINDKIYQLSWRAQRGFIWNAEDLSSLGEFNYSGEGWGLTHNDSLIFRSSGSQIMEVMDHALNPLHQIQVYNHRGPVIELNELEYIDGLIFANIYGTNEIGIIEPETGRVLGYLDLTELEKGLPRTGQKRDVLNGIALNHESGHIYVTGKLWPQLFELKLKRP